MSHPQSDLIEDDSLFRGWVHLGISADIRPGTLRTVTRFGRDIVVRRSRSGRLSASTSVCPHLGAHLGGGDIVGECIRCPFHEWQFDPHGDVFHVPGARRLPPRARLESYVVREIGGIVFYYHQGTADPITLDPAPRLHPRLLETLALRNGRRRTFQTLRLPASLASIAENVPDSAHFTVVHRSQFKAMTAMSWTTEHGTFKVSAETQMGPTKAPCISEIEYFDAFNMQAVTINQHTGSMFIILMLAPVGGGSIELLVAADSRGTLPILDHILNSGFRKLAVRGISEDRPIWQKKSNLERPVLSDADGPIMQFRRWHEQFRRERNTDTSTESVPVCVTELADVRD